MKQKGEGRKSKRWTGAGRSKGIKLGWAEIVALAVVIFCLGFVLGRFMDRDIEYMGPGEPKELPTNDYDTSAFSFDDRGRLVYNDDSYDTINVIDVSYVQKEIDWQKVADDDIEMAMIRLGYRGYSSGLLNLDEYYEANIEGAKEAGLKYGVYFFSQAVSVEEAQEEAQFVIKNIKGRKVKGPIAFDMEPIEGADRISALSVEQKTEIADAFLDYIEKKGYDAMLYGNPSWLRKDLDLSLLTEHPVWLAHYTDTAEWPYWYSMWQYTSKGKVSGIKGNVDLSIGFGG